MCCLSVLHSCTWISGLPMETSLRYKVYIHNKPYLQPHFCVQKKRRWGIPNIRTCSQKATCCSIAGRTKGIFLWKQCLDNCPEFKRLNVCPLQQNSIRRQTHKTLVTIKLQTEDTSWEKTNIYSYNSIEHFLQKKYLFSIMGLCK